MLSPRLKYVILIIALILWVFSLTQSKLVIDNLGLFNSFPPHFISVLVFSLYLGVLECINTQQDRFIEVLTGGIIVISLYLIPFLIGGSQRGEFLLLNTIGQVNQVIAQGHITASIPDIYLSGGFPGLFVLFSYFFQVTGISTFTFSTTFLYIFWELLFLPLYFVIGRTFLPRRFLWTYMLLFVTSQWLVFNSLFPEVLGFFDFLTMLILIQVTGTKSCCATILFFVVCGAIIISHGLSGLFAFTLLFGLWLFYRNSIFPLKKSHFSE